MAMTGKRVIHTKRPRPIAPAVGLHEKKKSSPCRASGQDPEKLPRHGR